MKYIIPVNKDNIYAIYLKTINGVLDLTETEISIVAELIKGYNRLAESDLNESAIFLTLFSKEFKKAIQSNLGISGANFNNYMSSLIRKKAVIETEKGKSLNKVLFPVIDGIGRIIVSFEFKLETVDAIETV